jgi:hypothetical protein
MFPLTELLSHAELTKRQSRAERADARRAPRRTRYGTLTLFPCLEKHEPVIEDDESAEERWLVGSISNVSTSGVGLILADKLPNGMEFDVQWPEGDYPIPLRFEVVHSRPISAGLYRTGARLIAGVLPEQAVPTNFVSVDSPEMDSADIDVPTDTEFSESIELNSEAPASPVGVGDDTEYYEQASTQASSYEQASPVVFAGGILKFEPQVPDRQSQATPVPAGTFRASHALGFDKTETLNGVTTCGWDRSVQIRRDGDRLWIYIHSPGKKNGWGIFVDSEKFQSAFDRIQQAAQSPFISTLAA